MRGRTQLAAALIVLVAACEPQPSSSPSGTDAMPDVSALPAIEAAWDPIDLPDARGNRYANGVIADSDGFVVYGAAKGTAIAWTSADAADWDAVVLGGEGAPTKAAATGDATVLIGGGSTSRCPHPFAEFLWRGVTGDRSWEVVPFNARLFCAGGFPAIAARDDMFMVAGMGTGDVPFAWSSPDGLDWLDSQAGLPLDAPPPWALAATEEDFIELGRGERTEVRTNRDGREWLVAVAPPVAPAFNEGGPGMSPAVLLATSEGALAIYQEDDAGLHSAWLRQADGSWAPAAIAGLGAGDWISGGTTLGDVTCLFLTRRHEPARVLVSTDLVTWRELSIPDVKAVLGLARFDARLVLVVHGNRDDRGPDRALVFAADSAVLPTD